MLCEAKASSLCSVPEVPSPEGEQIIKVHQADKKEGYSIQKEHRTWSQEMGGKHGVCVEKHSDLCESKGACGKSLLVEV